MEDELLDLVSRFMIVDFQEGSSYKDPGPVDIAFVEGTVSTEHDLKKLVSIRKRSKLLIAFGNCAIDGCIQTMRNKDSTLEEKLKDALSNYTSPCIIDQSASDNDAVQDDEVFGC